MAPHIGMHQVHINNLKEPKEVPAVCGATKVLEAPNRRNPLEKVKILIQTNLHPQDLNHETRAIVPFLCKTDYSYIKALILRTLPMKFTLLLLIILRMMT